MKVKERRMCEDEWNDVFKASRSLEHGLSTNFTLELQIPHAVCRQTNNRHPRKKREVNRRYKVRLHLVFKISVLSFNLRLALTAV